MARRRRLPAADSGQADASLVVGSVAGASFEQIRGVEPVVTSCPVCDQFPTSSVGDWMPPWPDGVPRQWTALSEDQRHARAARSDAWYDLDAAEQWRISMEGLRASADGLELQPDN